MIDTIPEHTKRLINRYYSADPREVPIYSIAEAARYIKVHENTLRSWVHGRTVREKGKVRTVPPVIELDKKHSSLLSFINFLEAYSLSALTRIDNLKFQKIRIAIETMKGEGFRYQHPLIEKEFLTDSIDLFIQQEGKLYNVSRYGQLEIKDIVQTYLRRVVHDPQDNSPRKLYPYSREIRFDLLKNEPDKKRKLEESPKHIEVDPLISFGRPTITGTGIPVEVIASRRRAGDNVVFLAEDYGISKEQVQEAIEYERRPTRKAA